MARLDEKGAVVGAGANQKQGESNNMKIEEIAAYLKIPLLIATGLARAGFLDFHPSLVTSNVMLLSTLKTMARNGISL